MNRSQQFLEASNYPDDIRSYDNDPRSPFYKNAGADDYAVDDKQRVERIKEQYSKKDFPNFLKSNLSEFTLRTDAYGDVKMVYDSSQGYDKFDGANWVSKEKVDGVDLIINLTPLEDSQDDPEDNFESIGWVLFEYSLSFWEDTDDIINDIGVISVQLDTSDDRYDDVIIDNKRDVIKSFIKSVKLLQKEIDKVKR